MIVRTQIGFGSPKQGSFGVHGSPLDAAQVVETGGKAAPHPARWLAYRDLKTTETPRQRADRLRHLATLNPGARESRILMVEQALVAGDLSGAQLACQALEREPVTAATRRRAPWSSTIAASR